MIRGTNERITQVKGKKGREISRPFSCPKPASRAEPPPDLRKHSPPLFCREYLQNLRHSQGCGHVQPDSQTFAATFAKSRTCAGLRTCAGIFRVADICSDFCCLGHLQPVQRLFPAAPDCAAFASTRATISTKTPAVLHRGPGQVSKYKNTSSLTVLQ